VQTILTLVQNGFKSGQLYDALKEALECRICRDIIVISPLLYSKSFKQLIACSDCLQQLGEEPSCPNCRELGLTTLGNHTFDPVLQVMSNIINGN